jgi:hypothetical protein
MTLSVLSIVGVLLTSMAIGGCSKSPPALSENELLMLLAAAKQEGPYQFQRQTWPRLEKKTIRYCGPLEESKVIGANAVLLLKVDKEYAGEKLPWFLEGKSASPSVAQAHTKGEAVCLTGMLDSYMERNNVYWGYVNLVSVEKSATS